MDRIDIVETIGKKYNTFNIEKGEFSYPSAYKEAGIEFVGIKNTSSKDKKKREYQFLDIRFEKNNYSVLVETKQDFYEDMEAAKEQLNAYVEYEKNLTNNRIIAILANTKNDEIMVWRGAVLDKNYLEKEKKLKTIDEYINLYLPSTNNKEKVMKSTFELNNMLHKFGITESLRSQFIGTCILVLKNGLNLNNPDLTADDIRGKIKTKLSELLTNDINKAGKIALLDKNVLNSQDITDLDINAFRKILSFINTEILPFINDKSTAGQDLLNLFFVTFNKYADKKDKNQVFTPDHITDFMAKVCQVNKDSIVLDPCCGSASFLVRAMVQALDDCLTEKEQSDVMTQHIYGIEYFDSPYGLATTNMLIHGDGNSNIIQASCFDKKAWILKICPNVVLMNPPYNANKKTANRNYWLKTC